jgi:hypothetical protein
MPDASLDLVFKWIGAILGGAGFLLSLFNFWRARAITRIRLVRMHTEDQSKAPVMVMNIGNQPCIVCEIWARHGEYLTAHKSLVYSVSEDSEAKSIEPGSARTFDLPSVATNEEGEVVVYTAVLQNQKQIDGILFFDSGAWEIALRLVCDAIVQRSQALGNPLPAKLLPVVHSTGFRIYADALPKTRREIFSVPPLLKAVKPTRSKFRAYTSALALGIRGRHIASIGISGTFTRNHEIVSGLDQDVIRAVGNLVPEAFEVVYHQGTSYLLWTPLMVRIAFGREDVNSLRAVLKDVRPGRSFLSGPGSKRQKVRRR